MKAKTSVKIAHKGSAAVVAFRSATVTDIEEIRGAGEEIGKFISEARPKKVVFDFINVRFFSSQVLGLLLNIRNRVQRFNGEVVISAINPQLHRVFRITNLDSIFRFFPDSKSAVNENDRK